MRMRSRHIILLALAGAGCAVGPDFHHPAAPSDGSYTPEPVQETAVAGGKSQRFVEGREVAAKWWQLLHCPALDGIVARALAGSPGLESARATLRRNQDSLRAGYGVFFPQLDLQAGASRQLYNPAPGAIPASSPFNLFTLSGSVSYTIDVWGGERRQVEVLGAAVDAQRYALAGAYVMLASNVVDAVIAQSAYQAQIDATNEALAILREQVSITNAQATAGTVPYATVLTLQSQLASTRATLPPLKQKIDQTEHLLAALSGETPGSWKGGTLGLSELQLPEDLPLTLPSRLVRQRADVLIADAELHAANATIGVATAAMLPNITLGADYGVNATALAGGAFWSLGAGLTQPIFHGGTLNYQRKAAIEARDAAAADYRQIVLAAFEQVADTLRGLDHDAETLVAQSEAVETAEKAMRLIQTNYVSGIATYLQVLVADIQFLQTRIVYIQAVAQRLQDTVALYAALGGGWWDVPEASHG
jgi:NodT family efflux transporter outer membrane factor (OMF) lipoprotein